MGPWARGAKFSGVPVDVAQQVGAELLTWLWAEREWRCRVWGCRMCSKCKAWAGRLQGMSAGAGTGAVLFIKGGAVVQLARKLRLPGSAAAVESVPQSGQCPGKREADVSGRRVIIYRNGKRRWRAGVPFPSLWQCCRGPPAWSVPSDLDPTHAAPPDTLW